MELVFNLYGFKLPLVVTMLMMVIAMQPTVVKAVDILGFKNPSACRGSGYISTGVGAQTCAPMNAGSIQIRDLDSCATGWAYRNGECTSAAMSGNGPHVWCFTGGSFTGGKWFNGCRRRKLQGTEIDGDRCRSTAVPNGVHYTEDISTGSWMLKTPNATDMLAQLLDVDDAEKVNWLKVRGAYHVAGSDKVKMV